MRGDLAFERACDPRAKKKGPLQFVRRGHWARESGGTSRRSLRAPARAGRDVGGNALGFPNHVAERRPHDCRQEISPSRYYEIEEFYCFSFEKERTLTSGKTCS